MPAPPWMDRLHAVADQHGLDAASVARLARLLEFVRDDPTAPTTVRDPAVAVDAHIADSLSALSLDEVREAQTIADLGAGAGFPGIPLAVALPAAAVVLIESVGRKCAFLGRAVEVAGAANARVACARIEEWPERDLDVVAVRAVAPLGVLVEYAAPALRLGGRLVAWKGRPDPLEETAAAGAAREVGMELARAVGLTPRPGADHRTLYVYSKVRETPAKFPRRPGMARKRPL
ncbi:16S rRNA (guanine(527)-N(7))-methyltransferase RsmG [Capillimicrobium parvum]|uniref:Ribosomal RNA small subunit methyltransferase G n=1 Tax=Capillimicrobium parvum TaxID=2884022 RepID=A0A9E6Y9P0_9ACTN|nr:RsmG family class I SAM-dependent methyltransferase [Capillimicrobium parvum]UGS39321.1 Ribosomal RNA small subunit methyltransferase G [Capillimicrobium parvum]